MSSLFVFLGVGEFAESLAEGGSKVLSEGFPSVLGLEVVVLDVLEVELVDQEASRDDVILVHVLDEGLDAGLLDELLLAVTALDSGHVPGDAGHQ